MLKPLSIYALLLLISGTAFAQSKTSAVSSATSIAFLTNDGHYVSTRDSADYIRVITSPDSGSTLYNVQEVYKNNHRKFIGKSSKGNLLYPEGQCIGFYPNGNKKFMENYVSGKLNGVCYYYYPNGKIYNVREYIPYDRKDRQVMGGTISFNYIIKDCLDSTGKVLVKDGFGHYVGYDNYFKHIEEEGAVKNGKRDSTWTGVETNLKVKFTEQYADGKLVSGSSTDSAGVTHTYTQRVTLPQYKGGETALYRYLGSHIEYPKDAVEKNIHGTVVLKFVVKRDGSLTAVEVLKSVSSDLDEEAMRVVKGMKGWLPGQSYGIPEQVYYMLPVTFALQ
ncbi:MAG: TonB family protein [Bacteroidetes bacterium]|nr:TonB family protein [Bacteroidota bacterium]